MKASINKISIEDYNKFKDKMFCSLDVKSNVVILTTTDRDVLIAVRNHEQKDVFNLICSMERNLFVTKKKLVKFNSLFEGENKEFQIKKSKKKAKKVKKA